MKGDGKGAKSDRVMKAGGSGDPEAKAKAKTAPVPSEAAKASACAGPPPKLLGVWVSGDAMGGSIGIVEPGLVGPKATVQMSPGRLVDATHGGGAMTAGLVPNGARQNEVPGAMSDASKRLRESNEAVCVDGDDGFEMLGSPPTLPKSPNFMPVSMQWSSTWREASIDYSRGDHNVPLPTGVASYPEWGKTLIQMPKFKDANLTYHDLARGAINKPGVPGLLQGRPQPYLTTMAARHLKVLT